MWHKDSRSTGLSRRFVVLTAIFLATDLLASAQSFSGQPDEPRDPSSTRESLRWFVTSTIGPPHLAGGILVSNGSVNERGLKDVPWHGTKLDSPGWADAGARALAMTLAGFGGDSD